MALGECDGRYLGGLTRGIEVAGPFAGMLAPGTGAFGEAERRQVGSGIARSRASAAVKLTAHGQRVGRWRVS